MTEVFDCVALEKASLAALRGFRLRLEVDFGWSSCELVVLVSEVLRRYQCFELQLRLDL